MITVGKSEPIRYADDVEQVSDEEAAITEKIIATMLHTQGQVFEEFRHGTAATHAKSHGIATGTLTVAEGLRPELAQGLFAQAATYEVVLRYASEPHRVESDALQRARGVALKVLDVPGKKLREG